MRRAPSRLLLAALLPSSFVLAQGVPTLVKDIVTQSRYGGGSNPQGGVSVGGVAYFTAWQPTSGSEVWCSDGTSAGTRLPAEIVPGPGGWVSFSPLLAFGNRVAFSDGREIWLGDGTVAGTQPIPRMPFGNFTDAVEMGGVAYVAASDRAGVPGLWRTDFTSAGTTLIRAFSYAVHHLTVVGGRVLFFATDNTTGTELWSTDTSGTTASLVLDIWPGPAGSILIPRDTRVRLPVTPAAGMFFPAHDGSSGLELWCSDGTLSGTRRVADIFAGLGSGVGPWEPALLGNSVVFAATDGASPGFEPWITDGTAAGTRRIARLGPPNGSSDPAGFTSLTTGSGPVVCFWADDGVVGVEPWVTDGTLSGTVLLRDITPGYGTSSLAPARAVVGGRLVFAARDYSTGLEPWVTDGTPGGTALLRDIRPGFEGSLPTPVALTRNGLLLAADDGVRGVELWLTDGTTNGTVFVADLAPDAPGWELREPMTLGDRLLFQADGDLWRSDATANGTARIRSAGYSFFQVRLAASLPDAAVFVGDDTIHGRELWRSDGTTSGTMLVQDINPRGDGLTWDLPQAVNLAASVVLFTADDGTGRQLWRTDGTALGTQPVTSRTWSGPYCLTVLEPGGGDRIVLFTADDGVTGLELWRSDGTSPGTALVKDIWPGPTGSDDELGMLAMGSFALLAVSDGVSGFELWRSDGTAGGTFLVKDIQSGPGSSAPELRSARVVGGVAYFVADDGISGRELWKSDGTTAGTVRFADVWPGISSSLPAQLTELAGALLFSADDGSTGRELWHTNGTLTRRLTDLRPGLKSSLSDDSGFIFAPPGAHRAIFTASDGSSPGLQLWWTDGTTVGRHHAGTYGDGWQHWPHLAGTKLYVPVWDATTGHELWAMRSMAAAVPFGFGCRASNGWPTLRGTGPVLGANCDLQITPTPTVAAFALDAARTDIPLGGGCTLYLPSLAVVVPSTSGQWRIPVPNVPALNGRQIFAQAAQYDVSRSAIVWTNGLQLVLATE